MLNFFTWSKLFGFIPCEFDQTFNNLLLIFALITFIAAWFIMQALKLIVKISEVLKNV